MCIFINFNQITYFVYVKITKQGYAAWRFWRRQDVPACSF